MWGLGSSKSRGYGEDDGYAGLKVSERAKIWFLANSFGKQPRYKGARED